MRRPAVLGVNRGTPPAETAERAGVAVPTVYASVGPKPVLLRLLLDRINEQADIPRRAGELMASTDPNYVLRREVAITRTQAQRCGDILAALASAAGVEPEMAGTYQAGMARHRGGAEATVSRLVGFHSGRVPRSHGREEDRAKDLVAPGPPCFG